MGHVERRAIVAEKPGLVVRAVCESNLRRAQSRVPGEKEPQQAAPDNVAIAIAIEPEARGALPLIAGEQEMETVDIDCVAVKRCAPHVHLVG